MPDESVIIVPILVFQWTYAAYTLYDHVLAYVLN